MIQSSYIDNNDLYEYELNIGHMTVCGLSNKSQINPELPLVLMLHGYLDNANSFINLLTQFKSSKTNYQYLAIDHAGHGNSSHRSQDAHYHLVDYAYDLHQLIEQLGIKKVILIGHSLGGIVSCIYASTQPKSLVGLIAIESCGPLSETESLTANQLSECFKSRQKALMPIKQPNSVEQVVKARLLVSDFSIEAAQQIMQRNLNIKSDGSCSWKTDKRLRTKSTIRMTEAQSLNILENITCNRLFILGDKGFEKVKKGILSRPTAFQNVDVCTFSGGHHVHIDDPKNVATKILEYLNVWL